jgi:hypothetical protein
MLQRASRFALRSFPTSQLHMRFSSGIKLLNERAKAEEDYYFSKQDGMSQTVVKYIYDRKAHKAYDSG